MNRILKQVKQAFDLIQIQLVWAPHPLLCSLIDSFFFFFLYLQVKADKRNHLRGGQGGRHLAACMCPGINGPPTREFYSFRALERSNALRQDASCATTKARFMDPPGTLRVCGRGQGG